MAGTLRLWSSGPVDAVEIAEVFGLGGAARLSDRPAARGKQGEVWRLDTTDGTWAVKVPFDADSEEDVRLSTAFHEAAYDAGVPTPQVRRTTDGAVFATVAGRPVRVYAWVDLGAPDLTLDPALVGAAVAAIHQVELAHEGAIDPWYDEPIGAARWDELVGQLRAAGAPFAGRLADLRDELVALESWLEPPRDPAAVPPRPVGRQRAADGRWRRLRHRLGEQRTADPAQELGCVLFEFGRNDPGRARSLAAAYEANGGPARVERRGDFSMLIAQLGHITEIAARDWLVPNPRSPERADSEAWISEVLDEPHTPAVLDRLLAALRDR